MRLQFLNQAAFTSDPLTLLGPPGGDVFLGITGAGPVALEHQGLDGVWRSWPETTFSGPAAAVVRMPSGSFRVVISGAGPTTVDLQW